MVASKKWNQKGLRINHRTNTCQFIDKWFYLFDIIKKASIFYFEDDNTLPALSKTITGLLHILQPESLKIIKWFEENKVIVNAGKFQVLLIDKRKQYHTKEVVLTAWKVPVFEVILVRIQSECVKIRTRIISNTDTFYAVSNRRTYHESKLFSWMTRHRNWW